MTENDRATTTRTFQGTPIADVSTVPAFELRDIQVTLDAVLGEVLRQDTLARQGKFGGTHILPSGPDFARLAVLTEEVGEVARELNEAVINDQLDRHALMKELIQVGACAVAWATALDHEGYF